MCEIARYLSRLSVGRNAEPRYNEPQIIAGLRRAHHATAKCATKYHCIVCTPPPHVNTLYLNLSLILSLTLYMCTDVATDVARSDTARLQHVHIHMVST